MPTYLGFSWTVSLHSPLHCSAVGFYRAPYSHRGAASALCTCMRYNWALRCRAACAVHMHMPLPLVPAAPARWPCSGFTAGCWIAGSPTPAISHGVHASCCEEPAAPGGPHHTSATVRIEGNTPDVESHNRLQLRSMPSHAFNERGLLWQCVWRPWSTSAAVVMSGQLLRDCDTV